MAMLRCRPKRWEPELTRVALTDTTGNAVFDCVPPGRYAVRALWIGDVVIDEYPRPSAHGSGEIQSGWYEVAGDSVIVRGGQTDTTRVRRVVYSVPYPAYR